MKSQVLELAAKMRQSARDSDRCADEAFATANYEAAVIWHAQARQRDHMAAQLDVMASDLR